MVKYHYISGTMSISKIFIPNFVRVLTNKRKYIEQSFYSVAGVMPLRWDLGVLGVKNFSVGICDGAPSTKHSSLYLSVLTMMVTKKLVI